MRAWTYLKEPKLDELLDDDVLRVVVRSTGLTTSEFREELARLACRLRHRQPRSDGASQRAAA